MIHYLKEFSRSLWLLRAPIIVVVLFAFLMQQEQIQEIYSIFISNAQDMRLRTPILALLSVLGLCLILWAVGRDLSLADARENPTDATNRPGAKGHILRNMPALIACLPLLLTTTGMLAYSGTLEKSFVKDPSTVDAAQDTAVSTSQTGLAQTLNANTGKLRQFNDLLGVALDNTEAAVPVISNLQSAVYVLAGLTLIFAIFVFWRANFSIVTDIRIVKKSVAWAVAVVFFACLGLAAAQSSVPDFDFTRLPRSVGAIFIINLFLICLTVSLAILTRLNDVQGIPVLTFIIAGALLGSSNNWNDNHSMRVMPVQMKAESSARSAEMRNRPAEFTDHPNARPLPIAFFDWFENRPQARLEMFAADGMQNPANPNSEVRKYPVYIVAAQGGGLYASYLTAITLARMYDQCPALRHHVFAISGVSGGSVGAGVVSALLQSVEARGYVADDAPCPDPTPLLAGETQNPGFLELRVRDFFAGDLLSPLATSALFADLPQRALPVNVPYISQHLDRSRAFEASMESQWATVAQKWDNAEGMINPFRAPFRDQWRAEGQAPMLVLNITAVNSGQQVLAAPFVTDRSLFFHVNNSALQSMYPSVLRANEDIRLSTAVGLSARFPLVLSAASKTFGKSIVRFGDGGYYENSGVDTALAMVRDLKFYKDNAKLLIRPADGVLDPRAYANIEFRLIVLNEYYKADLTAGGFSEVLSPLLGLYNTRTHRGRLAIDRALASGAPVHMVRLMHGLFPMPLGWQFSQHTSAAIRGQLGTARECRGNALFKTRMRDLKKFLNAERARPGGGSGTGQRADNRLDQLPVLARILQENRCSQREVIRAVMPGVRPEPS